MRRKIRRPCLQTLRLHHMHVQDLVDESKSIAVIKTSVAWAVNLANGAKKVILIFFANFELLMLDLVPTAATREFFESCDHNLWVIDREFIKSWLPSFCWSVFSCIIFPESLHHRDGITANDIHRFVLTNFRESLWAQRSTSCFLIFFFLFILLWLLFLLL